MDDDERRRLIADIEQAAEAFIVPCPHCGARMSKRARRCPSCQVRVRVGKNLARTKAQTMQAGGRLVRQPCEVCGSSKDLHKHHEDYSDPARVRWLCAGCHQREHDEIRAGNKSEPALPPMTNKIRYTH